MRASAFLRIASGSGGAPARAEMPWPATNIRRPAPLAERPRPRLAVPVVRDVCVEIDQTGNGRVSAEVDRPSGHLFLAALDEADRVAVDGDDHFVPHLRPIPEMAEDQGGVGL